MEEDEHRPTRGGRSALWGEDANLAVAEIVVLGCPNFEGRCSTWDSRRVAKGGVPRKRVWRNNVLQQFFVEIDVVLRETVADVGMDGLVDLLAHSCGCGGWTEADIVTQKNSELIAIAIGAF